MKLSHLSFTSLYTVYYSGWFLDAQASPEHTLGTQAVGGLVGWLVCWSVGWFVGCGHTGRFSLWRSLWTGTYRVFRRPYDVIYVPKAMTKTFQPEKIKYKHTNLVRILSSSTLGTFKAEPVKNTLYISEFWYQYKFHRNHDWDISPFSTSSNSLYDPI